MMASLSLWVPDDYHLQEKIHARDGNITFFA